MTRFDRSTRSIHEQTQDNLYEVVRRLETVLSSGSMPDESTRQDCISLLSTSLLDVQLCSDSIDDLVMRFNIAEFRIHRHTNLIHWINELSIALKLLHIQAKPLTLDLVQQGTPLIEELDNCRERIRWDR